MYKINSVKIIGFWNQYNINYEFNKNIDIFIGENGTGKTTFINIIEASLTCNINMICKYQFKEVELNLYHENNECVVRVKKDEYNTKISYIVHLNSKKKLDKVIHLGSHNAYMYANERSSRDFYSNEHLEVYRYMRDMFNIVLLSVNRKIDDNRYKYDAVFRNEQYKYVNSVDEKLNNLCEEFMKFKANLELKVKRLSIEFEKQVLKLLLYNEEMDKLKINLLNNSENFEREKEGLYNVYKLLDALDSEVISNIDKHIYRINQVSEKYRSKSPLEVEDIMPIALLARTEHLVEETILMEKKKKEIYEPLEKFKFIVSKFMKNKEINYDSNQFIVSRNRKTIPLEELSSGEKQLLILLMESMLLNNQQGIFIADEPELSLHITWQEKIVPSIMELNKNVQIIVATHSPEIAGSYPEKTVNMEHIINGGNDPWINW